MDRIKAFMARNPADVSLSEIRDMLYEMSRRDEREYEKHEKERIEREKERIKREKEREKERERLEMLERRAKAMSEELNGISKSNSMMSENLVYVSLWETKTIGGIHYDVMRRGVNGDAWLESGTRLFGEYDVVLYNATAVCIVEVKYRVREEDVHRMADRQADSFKKIFASYARHKFYLAIGGMSFDKEAVKAAEELGIGVLQVKGDVVEISDKNMKVY